MAMRKFPKIFAGVLLASMVSIALAAESFEDRIRALEPVIGHYPADIKDAQDASAIKTRYEALKRDLDAAVAADPSDERLRAQRGALQSMGHNFDYRGAWDGATKDLTAALRMNPNDVRAILALAQLWVNSRPDLAGKAEQLFRAAQCHEGEKPLEEAQRGLFFAFYYQGKTNEAYRQALYLNKAWPDNQGYAKLFEVSLSVLQKKGGKPPEAPATPTMIACAEKAH